MTRDQRQEREISGAVELRPMSRVNLPASINRTKDDPAVGSRFDFHVCTQADRRVQGRGAFMKYIERPDVDRAAREVDARRR